MKSRKARPQIKLLHYPCSRCQRSTAFVGDQGLCPTCRAEELERAAGLPVGLLRQLAAMPSQPARPAPARPRRGAIPRRAATRVA